MEEKKENKRRSFWDTENLIWRVLGSFMDLVYISLMWLVCSIPLVTIGAASTALYDTVAHCIRNKESGLLDRFFGTFKRELKNATLSWLLLAVAAGMCVVLAIYICSLGNSKLGFLFTVNLVVLTVIVGGALTWVFPILSRFQMSLGKLNMTAIQMTIAHLPTSIIMTLVTVLGALACYIWLFPVVFVPGLIGCVHSYFIEKSFSKFM